MGREGEKIAERTRDLERDVSRNSYGKMKELRRK